MKKIYITGKQSTKTSRRESKLTGILLLFLLFIHVPTLTRAQSATTTPDDNNIVPEYVQILRGANPNIRDLINSYNNYYKTQPWVKNTYTREYNRFVDKISWSNYDANGNRIETIPVELQPTGLRVKKAGELSTAAATDWKSLPIRVERTHATATGQKSVIRTIAVHPSNPSIVLAACGGLWKSNDKGATWSESLQNNLPFHRGVNHIEFSDTDPNYVYAATSAGIIKSTDGGNTWTATKINYSSAFPNVNYGGDGYRSEYMWVDVSPNDPNTIVATDCNPNGLASRIGRSTDGGNTWTYFSLGTTNFVFSLKYHPTNPNIVHALVKNGSTAVYYRSTDGGITFTKSSNFPVYDNTPNKEFRGVFATTPAKPDMLIYYLNVNEDGVGVFKSTDAGLTFSKPCCGGITPVVNITTNKRDIFGEKFGAVQIRWATAFSISDVDTNFMALSTNAPPRFSFDGGTSWYWKPDKKDYPNGAPLNMIYPSGAATYIHGDIQATLIRGNDVWVANDGGIALSEDRGQTFREVGDGIASDMALGFDNTPGDKDVMVIALDHNGVIVRDTTLYGDKWKPFGGGDASAASINPIDDRWMYCRPSGNNILYRPSTNQAAYATYNNCSIQLGSGYLGQFVNVQTHPNNYYILYTIDFKTNQVVKSTDNGVSWTMLKQLTVDGYAYAEVKVAQSNPNYIYVSEKAGGINNLWKSTDGGLTWKNIIPNHSAITSYGIRNVEVSSTDPNMVWISIGGHQKVEKVLRTINGGTTWTTYTNGLPAYAILSLIHQRGTNGGVYVGTSYGVYYRNVSMPSWVLHGTNFPGIEARFLRINYAHNKIRVGTHSGIFENALYERTAPQALITANKTQTSCGSATIQFASLSATSNKKVKYAWSFPGGMPESSSLERPEVAYSTAGSYPVTLTVTDEFGSNTSTLENFITVKEPCQTGKINPAKWTIKYVDSQQTTSNNESALAAIDNNPATFWHTQYSPSSKSYPHELQVDLGEMYTLNGFTYLPRQDGNVNGRIKTYEIYTSTNGTSWTMQKSGTWVSDATEKTVSFNATDAQYFRLVAKSEVNNNAWASAAEVSVQGTPKAPAPAFTANKTLINEGDSITFSDNSTGKIISWVWTFEGGTPATSIDQNPTVKYATSGLYSVSLKTSNIGGSSTETKTAYINVSTTNALHNTEADKLDVQIVPNPSKNGNFSIQLHNASGISTLEIMSLTGQILFTGKTDGSSNYRINSPMLSKSGIYLLRIKNNRGNITRKIEVE